MWMGSGGGKALELVKIHAHLLKSSLCWHFGGRYGPHTLR